MEEEAISGWVSAWERRSRGVGRSGWPNSRDREPASSLFALQLTSVFPRAPSLPFFPASSSLQLMPLILLFSHHSSRLLPLPSFLIHHATAFKDSNLLPIWRRDEQRGEIVMCCIV